ncbi:MAG: cyclase family protein [Roseibium sp.]|nr:cyclase family protein [Roseibium sp.]
MCDQCVIETVKARMLSRRDVFKSAAFGAGAASVAAMSASLPAMAQDPRSVSDLTHELHQKFPTFGGEDQFFAEKVVDFAQDGYNALTLRVNEHTGTHMDAPLHFSEGGQSVAEIPVQNLVAPLCVVDIREKAAEDPDAQVTPDDLTAWMSAHGDLPQRACVAMNSGWDAHVNSARFRNADAGGTMHFPGFHIEAAQMLLEQADVIGIAVDTLSLDHGPSADFAVHYGWLPENRWGLECLANLGALPARGATLIVGAPKHRGGTGGPSRVMALV